MRRRRLGRSGRSGTGRGARPGLGCGRWRAGTCRSGMRRSRCRPADAGRAQGSGRGKADPVESWADRGGMIGGGHEVSPSWSGPRAVDAAAGPLTLVGAGQVYSPATLSSDTWFGCRAKKLGTRGMAGSEDAGVDDGTHWGPVRLPDAGGCRACRARHAGSHHALGHGCQPVRLGPRRIGSA